MTEERDYNSSDEEVEMPVGRFPNAGRKSIQRMIENQVHGRRMSQIRLESLSFTPNSPCTEYHYVLWMNRFNEWHKL